MLQRLVLAAAAAVVFGTSPMLAAEAWVGRWAIDPAACTGFGGDTPASTALVVTDTSLRWFSGDCRIGKMYKLGRTAYIQARCWGAAANDIPVTLDPRAGDRMRVTWNGGKTAEVRRCK